MRIFLLVAVLTLGSALSTRAQVPGASDSLRAQANRMTNGLISGDYTTFIRYMYPKVVELSGGTANLKQALQQMTRQFDSLGMSFQSITVDSLSDFVKTATQLQATIRQHTAMKVPHGRSVATSTLVGISLDNGVHWKFLDSHNMTLAVMRQVMPNLSTRLVIPPQQPPVHYEQ